MGRAAAAAAFPDPVVVMAVVGSRAITTALPYSLINELLVWVTHGRVHAPPCFCRCLLLSVPAVRVPPCPCDAAPLHHRKRRRRAADVQRRSRSGGVAVGLEEARQGRIGGDRPVRGVNFVGPAPAGPGNAISRELGPGPRRRAGAMSGQRQPEFHQTRGGLEQATSTLLRLFQRLTETLHNSSSAAFETVCLIRAVAGWVATYLGAFVREHLNTHASCYYLCRCRCQLLSD